ncbi:hypothetical protein DWG18_10730 [Lysobacter sp. TY2-98]|uniref:hypothetical protein n=1 Tax=Lysobacter sp. TY2-98 TaxID=2290922 RepID=UPI000E201734|nr:hypothetical protein [Lysobacter sp. TY2-98]AXK72701.1 hypothetical protein DWG18_10730 [Lysobacter sp. TY2-98]
MNVVQHLDDDCLIVHVDGPLSLGQARAIALDAISQTREGHVRRLLLDFTDADLAAAPTLSERFEILREWADAAPEPLSLAVAAREEMLDPDRIGEIMASRLGLRAHAFNDAVDALLWVKRHRVPQDVLMRRPMYH